MIPEAKCLLRTARYRRIALELFQRRSRREVAAVIGVTPRHLRRLMREPGFAETFERVSDDVYSVVLEHVRQYKIARLREIARRRRRRKCIGSQAEDSSRIELLATLSVGWPP